MSAIISILLGKVGSSAAKALVPILITWVITSASCVTLGRINAQRIKYVERRKCQSWISDNCDCNGLDYVPPRKRLFRDWRDRRRRRFGNSDKSPSSIFIPESTVTPTESDQLPIWMKMYGSEE